MNQAILNNNPMKQIKSCSHRQDGVGA